MPSIEMEVTVKVNGRVREDLRTVRRLEVDEFQEFDHEEASVCCCCTSNILSTHLDEVQALLVQAVDQQVTIRLDGQSDAGIVLNAGGLLAIIDCDIDAGASTNVLAINASGCTATVRGLAGGT